MLEALDVASAQQSPAEAAAAARAAAGARADTERPLRLAVRVLLLYLQVAHYAALVQCVAICPEQPVQTGK